MKLTSRRETLKVDELSYENKYLRQENSVLRIDVQNMEERVDKLRRFLEECKKTKADAVIDKHTNENDNGEFLNIRNENLSMSETMKVMAKLVQRQERSLKRHRQQSAQHQKEMKNFRKIIRQLERELYANQQKLFDVKTKDLSHKKRVQSLRRQIAYMESQLQSFQRAHFEEQIGKSRFEDDLNFSRKILEELRLPDLSEAPPAVDSSVESSSSERSIPVAAVSSAKARFGNVGRVNIHKMKEELEARKRILEIERDYLISEKKKMDINMHTGIVSDISDNSITSC